MTWQQFFSPKASPTVAIRNDIYCWVKFFFLLDTPEKECKAEAYKIDKLSLVKWAVLIHNVQIC